jgi:hypothetical protein
MPQTLPETSGPESRSFEPFFLLGALCIVLGMRLTQHGKRGGA